MTARVGSSGPVHFMMRVFSDLRCRERTVVVVAQAGAVRAEHQQSEAHETHARHDAQVHALKGQGVGLSKATPN
ncbi:hypothetical protein ACWGMA_40225 [Streptomyces asiaticus]